jgi:small subunit ribosomal protein S20
VFYANSWRLIIAAEYLGTGKGFHFENAPTSGPAVARRHSFVRVCPDLDCFVIIFVFRNSARPLGPGHYQEQSMANSAQARKRARQAVKQNAHNSSQRSALRTAIKAVRKAIEAGDKAGATQAFQSQVSIIDRIADKNIIHKNKASRHKSRLSAAIKALA